MKKLRGPGRLAARMILGLGGMAALAVCMAGAETTVMGRGPMLLETGAYQYYAEQFNRGDDELYVQYFNNAGAWDFLKNNIPLFECSDKDIEETYYFRWWIYRKHIKNTPDGFVITEFLPKVPWAGKYNTIPCAAGHHFREGRWLRDSRYLNDYAVFWFCKGGAPRTYSFWAADSLYQFYLVTGDTTLIKDLLPELVSNFRAWQEMRLVKKEGAPYLFWQTDGEDGGEMSIGGSGIRPTINSYMYGDAVAIAKIAEIAGRADLETEFLQEAEHIRSLFLSALWNPEQQFFEVLPDVGKPLTGVRELNGYTPWYFNLVPQGQGYEAAWQKLTDAQGFAAKYGPTTAEQRAAGFQVSYEGHECQWNGPSWPYATAITLTAMANLLNNAGQSVLTKQNYFDLLRTYTLSQRLKKDDGTTVPWIDENLNPFTGEWLARTRLKTWDNGKWSREKGGRERGKDYNHSTYCDLVITGLAGLRPRPDNLIEVNPLIPEHAVKYFCLDNVRYHGRTLTILYDSDGKRYQRGPGLHVFADGVEIASSTRLERVSGT